MVLREDVIKVELCRSAVPRLAVVKLNALAQRKRVNLTTVRVVSDRPRLGEAGNDSTLGTVLDKSIIHPVVREKFIGAIRMSVQTPDPGCLADHSRLRTRRDGDRS